MKRIHLAGCVAVIAAAIGLAGCDSGGDTGGSDMDAMVAQLEQNKKVAADAAAAEQAKVEAEKKAAEEAAARQAAAQQAATQTEQSAAPENSTTEGIVGKKQRRNQVDGPLRYYGAMANARIIAMDRTLGWQIKSALDGYVNSENDGKYPKTTEEFMEKVIEPNMIELPELEPNQEYFYDPADHELKIAELIDEPAEATPPQ
jgi:flagellar biosynthesis GTPase FlhF